MADYQSTQRLRSFFEEDDKEKKEGAVTVSQPDVDFSRADNSASHLKDAFADFGESAPSRQPKEEVEDIVEPPKEEKIFDWAAGGQAFLDTIRSVPNQTAKGLGMILGAPEATVEGAAEQLMRIDSYDRFMQDAAKGIDLGNGRAAVAVLNTGALGFGDVKPVLNTKVGQEIATNVEGITSNFPLKTVAAFRAIGEGTYKEYRDAMIADREDPENGKLKSFLFDLQDSGVQSLLGVLVTTGTVLATKNPKAGYAVGGAYYGSLSAAEQIQSEGEVTSSANIAIDVIGDSLINNALLGVFKMPASTFARTAATAGLEGTTEVVQSLLKFSNSYVQADTDVERGKVLEDAVHYVKSGAILTEFGIGAIVGGIAQTGVEVLNTAGTAKARTEVKNSLAFPIDAAIKAGDVDAATVYANGKDGVLTPAFADGRINDVAQKLGRLDSKLEAQYRESVDINNETMESIVSKGESLIDTYNVLGTEGAQEVLNTAGSKQPPETAKLDSDIYKDIEQVADLIARAETGQELSAGEQTALTQARQSFTDYSNAFETTTAVVDNPDTGTPAAEIQTVEVGDKVAVKSFLDVGETGLQLDFDLNTLYSSPEAATAAAIANIEEFIKSQLQNPSVSPVTQKRLEDTLKQLKGEGQTVTPPKTPEGREQRKPDIGIAIGNRITIGGKTGTISNISRDDNGARLRVLGDDGKAFFVNRTVIEGESDTKAPEKKAETKKEFSIKEDKEVGFVVREKKGDKNVVAGTFSTREKAEEFIKESSVTQPAQKKTAKTKDKKDTTVKKAVEAKKKPKTIYHATTKKSAEQIKEEGFKFGAGAVGKEQKITKELMGDVIFFAEKSETAKAFARVGFKQEPSLVKVSTSNLKLATPSDVEGVIDRKAIEKLKAQGFDGLRKGADDIAIWNIDKIRVEKPLVQPTIQENVTAEDTAEIVMANGKPEKAEQIIANANTLTVVPADLDTVVELETGEATRPDQKVSKTKLKGIFGKEDRLVFTILTEDFVLDGKETQRVYMYRKDGTSETKLRPSALGLVEDNLTVGQEIILDKSTLKGKGKNFQGVDSEGRVFAEPKAKDYKNNVLRKEDIMETLDATKTAGYYDSATRQKLFERYILPQLKRIGTLADDETVIYYAPADGDSGQYVNRDLGRVWWIPQIDGNFVVKKVKESELVTTGFSEKDKVGESLYFPAKTNKVALEDNRLRNLNNGRFVSKAQARKLASSEFESVSKLVKKAEPAGKKSSVFASREPKKDSKIGDVAMNREELSKGSEIEYNKLAKRSEIARVLTSKLGAVVRTGKFRQAANGIYNEKTDTIRLSNKNFSSREGGQLTTLIHEIGHYLDYSTFEFRSLIPKGEINSLLENYGNGAASVSASKKTSEAFAEFLRYYITMPTEAKKRAPEFHKLFEAKLEELPEIRDVLLTTQHEFKRWAEQPATSKVAAQISFDGKKDKGDINARMKTSLHTLYKMGVNDLHALDQFSGIAKQTLPELEATNDPAILARNMRGWIGRAQYFLESGTVKRDYWKKGKNGKFSVEKKGKGLKEILQPIEDKGALNDLSVYLVSRRALELHERDITSGITKEDADVALNELEGKYPEFAQVAQDLDAYQNDLLDYLQESGVLNGEDRAKMQEANKMYVPFFRVHEELTQQGFMGGKAIPTKSPIKKIKGSEKDIIDPLESIVKNTYVLINAAERNNVMTAMSKLANENKELGRLFERVPEDMSKVASVNPKDIVYQSLGADTAIGKASLPAEVQAAIDIVVPETMVNIFRPAMFQKGNVVTILEDGKSRHYELEEDLYNAVNSMEIGEADLMVQIMSYPAQFLRAGATLAPEFMVRNPLRDSIGAAVFSQNGFVPFYDTARGFASLVKKDEYYDAFVLSGGLQSTIVAQDRQNLTKSKDELLKRSARIKKLIKNPLEVLQILSQYTEQATRIGEARLALNSGKSTTQAAFDSREVTLDFQRAGTKTRNINRIAAFFNAKIQGNDKLMRSFIKHPARSTLKATMYITLPSVVLWFLNQDEEGYDEIPQWQKDIFWLVKVDETWYRIPKPFELGILFGSIPERFLDYLKTHDPEGLQEISRSFVTGLIPNPMPTGATPILENTTNYSFFLDRPIVSPSLENLPNADQYSANTSEISKLLGGAINYSPAKIDNLLYGYFAGLGRHTVNATDAILKGTGIVNTVEKPTGTKADVPVLKAFVVRDPSGSSSNSVNDFYENRTKATRHYNKYKNLLEEGERDKAREYLADHSEIKLYKSYNQIGGQLSDLRKLRDAVYNSETLTADKKREKIDELNALMTDTAYRANNIELK